MIYMQFKVKAKLTYKRVKEKIKINDQDRTSSKGVD